MITARIAVFGMAAFLISACATPPVALKSTQARVTGKGYFAQGRWVMVAPAGSTAIEQFSTNLIVPAGHQRITLRCNLADSGGEIFAKRAEEAKAKTVTEIEFYAKAGHEYRAELSDLNLETLTYRISDTATGAIVAEAQP